MKILITEKQYRLLLEAEYSIGKITGEYMGTNYRISIVSTSHSHQRSKGRELDLYDPREVANHEIIEFLGINKKEIFRNIQEENIISNIDFVIRSDKWGLSMGIIPINKRGNVWKFVIKTVFRESKYNKLRIGKYQFVMDV